MNQLASPLAVAARITEVTYSAVPEDHPAHSAYAVTVQWRGGETYAVMRRRWCLGADGDWDYEPRPSSRDDDWIRTHRFGYDTACRLAAEAARHVIVNGVSVADVLAEVTR